MNGILKRDRAEQQPFEHWIDLYLFQFLATTFRFCKSLGRLFVRSATAASSSASFKSASAMIRVRSEEANCTGSHM